MRILVLGSGGREHAIVWKLSKSERVGELFCIPGNGGISEIATCINIDLRDFEAIGNFTKREKIDMVVVGPEGPLAEGIADFLARYEVAVFGPSKRAALIEASKVFSKEFMKRNMINTADFKTFVDYKEALLYMEGLKIPFVIKADGLCGGKGAYVIKSKEEGTETLRRLMVDRIYGDAGRRIIIENFLEGLEVSYLVFSDGERILPLIPSQDHKPLLDEDKGPNTGGMGAYAPVPFVDKDLEEKIKKKIMEKAIRGLKDEGREYKGVLYGGLMIRNQEPYVLEFNARFGDPETQPILFLMESDLLPVLWCVIEGDLSKIKEINFKEGVSVCVVLASEGYPEKPIIGKKIKGLEALRGEKDIIVFHAGTKREGDVYITTGGRVLGVTAIGKTYKDAIDKVYEAISCIYFEGMHFRRDIGRKALIFEEAKDGKNL